MQFNNDDNSSKKMKQRQKEAWFTCGGEGHMAKDYPNKKDKGNAKVEKKATSNVVTELSEYDEVYINTLGFENNAAAKTTRPKTKEAHHALEGTMFIIGKEAKVLFDI